MWWGGKYGWGDRGNKRGRVEGERVFNVPISPPTPSRIRNEKIYSLPKSTRSADRGTEGTDHVVEPVIEVI